MNTKRVLALVLVLVLVLVLTPERAAKAEERVCPECGEDLRAIYADSSVHEWVCKNVTCPNDYDSSDWYIQEEHTLDKNCWCSVCEHYCHDLKSIGYDVHTQPTCTKPGLDYDGYLYLCQRCGNYTNNSGSIVNPVIDPLGHDWGDWVIDGDNHYRLCQRDGCEARDEAAHSYGNWTYVDDNTCKGVCVCGAEKADAHSGGTATCVKGPICEKCGSEYGNPDTENGHSWDTDWTWDDKEHWHPCNNEGCEAKLDAEAHSAHEPEIEQPGKPATCTSPGTTDATFCSVCGAPISEQEIIEPLGHKWDAEWSYDENDHYHKCLNDGCTAKSDDEAAHTGGTATCTAKAKCTVCGAEYGDFAEHVYPANVWWGDENEHWHVCTGPRDRVNEAGVPHLHRAGDDEVF